MAVLVARLTADPKEGPVDAVVNMSLCHELLSRVTVSRVTGMCHCVMSH